ncbi:bacterial ABC transporter protein EcsB [Gemella bergeri ATCC 700627]|uniref:Bacterial ABC transporter protein EcsB n=1 Tax=Gemella bergeri ATCC 700627 TaxID=1321820 RepID=U2QVP5_9BACL|nr:ABC transporter permease [Gemella bergeri]ERK60621.1 bacterial ABC transporter protein EcsB [Gemella bergeri ATCC 700627]
MTDITTIFNDRRKKEREKRALYSKYIFNSHLIMFLIIVLGAVMINYSKWLAVATKFEMRAVLIIAILLLSYLITFTKAKTFIKEADSVFLLPLEKYYVKIYKNTLTMSTIGHLVITVIFYFGTKPIIDRVGEFQNNLQIINVAILFLAIIVVNGMKLGEAVYNKPKITSSVLQYLILVLSLLKVVLHKNYYDYMVITIFIIMVMVMIKTNKVYTNINWYGAADYDKQRKENYLKFVNMFVDVPMDNIKVARRKYFDILLPKLKEDNFSVENSFKYYYYRVFLRQENTIFLALRLMLVAVMFIYSLKNSYVSMVIIVSYSYLTIIQLVPLYKKINNSIWSHVLPVKEEIKVNSFRHLLTVVMLLTTLLLTLISILLTNININNVIINIVALILANLVARIFIVKVK